MPKRSYVGAFGYRYGFNGKENDNDVKGLGNQQDYGMRIYDPRLGRFLSVDPLMSAYPSWSPYPFAMNRPVDGVDLDGLEWQPVNADGQNGSVDSKDIADYTWSGFNKDGKAKEGTVSSANLKSGGVTYEFRSNAEARTGSMTAYFQSDPKNRINAFIFSDNTAQWVKSQNGGQETGGYQTGFYHGSMSAQDKTKIDQDVVGFSGLDFIFRRGINRWIALPWEPQAIESDGIGPVELLIGIGELRAAGKGINYLGKSITKGVSVIGPRATYREFAKKIGASFLDVTDEAWVMRKNVEYLQGIIKRGDDIIFAGAYKADLLDPKSVLAQEIRYLIKHGYRWTDDFKKLVKK